MSEKWEPIGVVGRPAGGGMTTVSVPNVYIIERNREGDLRRREVALSDIPRAEPKEKSETERRREEIEQEIAACDDCSSMNPRSYCDHHDEKYRELLREMRAKNKDGDER